jgi:hypothetical protein
MNHFLHLIYCEEGGTCQQLFYHTVTIKLFDIFFLQNCVIMVVEKWIKCKDSITIIIIIIILFRPPLWSSGQSFWLQIQRSRVRSPALPVFLSSSGSGTGSTQPREVN